MAKEKVDFKGRRVEEETDSEMEELSISVRYKEELKVYFIILAYILFLLFLCLILPTSIAFIMWIAIGIGSYKGLEKYGYDKPWFSELSEMIQNFGFSSTKDDWGEGEVEDIDGETIEEENTLNFENYAEKFDEWRVTKDTVSAPFISAGDKISKFSFNSDGMYKVRLWILILIVPFTWGLLFAGDGILHQIFSVWYYLLGFSSNDALVLGNIGSLFLSYFLIIRIYSHCTNRRKIPFNSDMMSDYDPYVVSYLFQYPQNKEPVAITSKALLLDFIGGWFIILFLAFADTASIKNEVFGDDSILTGGFFTFVITLILFAIAVPIVEELLFRGLILDSFSEAYGIWTSIFISSTIFALLHVGALGILNAFWAGMIYGFLRIRTNSLWPGIILHGFWNGHLIILEFFYFT